MTGSQRRVPHLAHWTPGTAETAADSQQCRMRHALLVGGAGMLRGSVPGPGAPRVGGFCRGPLARPVVAPVPVDYHDEQALAAAVRAARTARGPIECAVCWVHDDAPSALMLVAEMIADARAPALFVHVAGCEALGPEAPRHDRAELRGLTGITYRRVVLGWVRAPGHSRWLTDEEICRGVLRAVGSSEPESVVGTTRPWTERP